jgi:hypothetical protein
MVKYGYLYTFLDINIIENFVALYKTEIKEIKDIITELIYFLPLK